MFKFENVLVFLIVCFAQVAAWTETREPGGIDLYFNTTGTNNLFQTLVPIGAYFALDGKSFNPNIKEKNFFYSLELNQVNITNAGGFTEKILDYEPGTNNVHIRIAGINLQTLINANFKALDVIPFEGTAVNVTNMTIDFKVAAQIKPDGVHWHMNETCKVTIGDLGIQMKNSFLNKLVNFNRKLIDLALNKAIIPYVEKKLTGEVDLLNKMISNEGPYTFYSNLLGFKQAGLNLTMTAAPEVNGASDLIKMYFDGLFVPSKDSGEKEIINFHENMKTFPPRVEHSLSQQFWVNEDTFNSLIEYHREALYPQTFNGSDISTAIQSAFPDLACSQGAKIAYTLDKSGSAQSVAIAFDSQKGVITGGRDNDVRSVVEIYCEGSETPEYKFSSQVQTIANLTMRNFVAYPSITEHTFGASIVLDGKLDHSKTYDTELNSVGSVVQSTYNADYADGWSLSHLNPMLSMAAGLIKNTTATPFVTDTWLYCGFEMQADLPNEEPVLEFIQ